MTVAMPICVLMGVCWSGAGSLRFVGLCLCDDLHNPERLHAGQQQSAYEPDDAARVEHPAKHARFTLVTRHCKYVARIVRGVVHGFTRGEARAEHDNQTQCGGHQSGQWAVSGVRIDICEGGLCFSGVQFSCPRAR